MSAAPAIFFDRDDTLIEDPGYISRPEQVRLFDDAADAVARLARAGFRIVVVSNQSGVARGLFTEDDLTAVNHRLQKLLDDRGAALDAIYCCPYLDGSEAKVAAYRRASDHRKPAPGMLLQAARDLRLDLERSWMIGDSARDIEAGRRAGCRTVLVNRAGQRETATKSRPDHVAPSLREAADLVLQEDGQSSPAEAPCESGPTRERPVTPTTSQRPLDADLLPVLTQIRNLLDRGQRQQRQQDFSLLRLVGALVQMLAIVAAVWGLYLLPSDAAGATARFGLAAFLQLAALTVVLADRRE